MHKKATCEHAGGKNRDKHKGDQGGQKHPTNKTALNTCDIFFLLKIWFIEIFLAFFLICLLVNIFDADFEFLC